MKSWTRLLSVAALTTLGVAVATAVAPNALAAPAPPTFSASGSGSSITVTVNNPNAGSAQIPPDSVCFPVIVEYSPGPGAEGPFRWVPDDVDYGEGEPPTPQDLTEAGFALPGGSSTSTVEVPRNGLYIVGAVCKSDDGESASDRVQPITIGPASGGTPISASPSGQRITATVTNNTAEAECTVVVVRLSLSPELVYTPDPTTDVAVNNGDTATITTGTLPPGYYAVSGICSDNTYSIPAKVVEIGNITPDTDEGCFGSLCGVAARP